MTTGSASLDRYLRSAVLARATDLLLTDAAPPLVRVDGRIAALAEEPYLDGAGVSSILSAVISPEQMAQYRRDRELDFSFSFEERVRVRGNAYVQRGQSAVALRMIPDVIPTMAELGLPPVFERLSKLPQGLVLMTGPTGSGKSTTQAAMLDQINMERACHILTIEDPVEYVHRNKRSVVSQREVGSDTHSFARALRSALREDPDVLLVGEMRDPESIAVALTIAETGHLVLSTLHTNDTSQALDRIVDVFPAEHQAQIRMQLAGTLSAVVAQRLIPRIGGGLVAAYEVLIANNAVRNLVREGKTRQIRNLITLGQAEGMITLEQSLNQLVARGVISYDDALLRAPNPQDIERPLSPAAR